MPLFEQSFNRVEAGDRDLDRGSKVQLEFAGSVDIKIIGQMIGDHVL